MKITINASKEIYSSTTAISKNDYNVIFRDNTDSFFDDPDDNTCTLADIKKWWNNNFYCEPDLAEYTGDFDSWFSDMLEDEEFVELEY